MHAIRQAFPSFPKWNLAIYSPTNKKRPIRGPLFCCYRNAFTRVRDYLPGRPHA
jgi:hypothetical protein